VQSASTANGITETAILRNSPEQKKNCRPKAAIPAFLSFHILQSGSLLEKKQDAYLSHFYHFMVHRAPRNGVFFSGMAQ